MSPKPKRKRLSDETTDENFNICNTFERYNSAVTIAGTIKSIELINFMCHSNFEIYLNPRANFITGLNGSGKSAIQTAIVVGLGGRALSTNRSLSLKGLIKQNCQSASICIVLNNSGSNAYMPDLFGDEIVVKRNFSRSGTASYKVCNNRGKVIYNKKDQLDDVLIHLKIQAGNPIAVLNQDMSKTFFNNVDPKARYALFKKATSIEEALIVKDEIDQLLKRQTEMLKVKQTVIEYRYKEIKDMEVKLKYIEDLKVNQKKKEELGIELQCSNREELVQSKKKFMDKYEMEKKLKMEYEEKIGKIDKNIEEMNEKLVALQDKLKNVDNISKFKEQERQVIEEELRQYRLTYNLKCSEFESLNEKLQRKKMDISHLQNSIRQQHGQRETQLKHEEEYKRKADDLQEILKDLEIDYLTCQKNMDNAKNFEANCIENLRQEEKQIRDYRQQFEYNTRQIRQMEKGEINLDIYGSWMSTLVQNIQKEDRKGKFTETPRGPFGLYIKVTEKKWVHAVENYLKRSNLTAFCVNQPSDRTLLYQIMERVIPKNEFKPIIYTGKFSKTLYNIVQKEAPCRPFPNMFRSLQISDTVVANSLIDNVKMESILLIPDNKDCYNLNNPENVPPRCSKAINLEADEFVPYPSFKCYSNLRPVKPKLLQQSVTHIIRSLEQENDDLLNLINDKNSKILSIRADLKEHSSEVKQLEILLNKLNAEINSKKKELRKYRDSVQYEASTLKKYQDELILIEQERDQNQEQIDLFRAEQNAYSQNLKEYETRLAKIKSECLSSQRFSIDKEIIKLNSVIEEQCTERNKIVDEILTRIANKINHLETKILEVDQSLQNIVFNLEYDRSVLRSVPEVEKELSSVDAYIDELEKKLQGVSVTFEQDLWRMREQYKNVKKLIKSIKAHHLTLTEQKDYSESTFYDVRLQMSRSVSENFLEVLRNRNYKGNLEFNHDDEKLLVHLSTTNVAEAYLNTGQLSGGERSFATVSFIMALWSTMNLPFYSMDEFDVYMDYTNRTAITNLLVSYAMENSCSQFIFLTPLDISSIVSNKSVDVHRLKNPRD